MTTPLISRPRDATLPLRLEDQPTMGHYGEKQDRCVCGRNSERETLRANL
jgi:hypothetical protein